jgi:hypothetical protein
MSVATLLYNATQFTLGEASEDIVEVVQAIAAGLPSLGYTGVEVSSTVQIAGNVHGFKGSFLLGVAYLPLGDRSFWQLIACGGDGALPDADAQIAEVVNLINRLTSL